MKKISIIGSGISGLCAGCYLQMNGFQTEIFEKHDIPGGLCTSWKKGEFTFDGSVHWILGSAEGSGFYKMWSEILDMKQIPFHNHDDRLCLTVEQHTNRYGSKDFIVYTHLDQFQEYLIDLAPEDELHIRNLIQDIRSLQAFEVPPIMDPLPFIPAMIRGIKMSRYLKFLFLILRQGKKTNFTVADQFKNPFLREAFRLLFDDYEVNMLVFNFPMASFDLNAGGYPIGGSLRWAQRIEQRYLELGGTIHYKTPVKKILVENHEAKGVFVRNQKEHQADIVLSAADWHHTLFDFLDGKYTNQIIKDIQSEKKLELYYSVLLVSFGLKRDYKEYYHFNRFPIKQTIQSPCGTRFTRLETHFYHYDPTLAPVGKTVMACSFYTKNGKYWIDLRKNDRKQYRIEKQQFVDDVKKALEEQYPGIIDDIEEEDFSTPATILRYTNNWQGSAQGWLPDNKKIFASTPIKFTLPGLKNFYYASHWSRPGGGVPVAINMARDVAKKICKDHGVAWNLSAYKTKKTDENASSV